MTESPRDDVVAQQYEKWTYPEPVQNLETWAANSWQWFDPSHAHRVLWPDRPHQADIDILIAGCGTNQAAQIAYMNRAAKVVAIDVSQPSLDHEKFLKDKYALKNLELHLLPIEEVPGLNQSFDLVMSTGVLHHMDDTKAGMKALADVLRPDGVAALMLYARYGRTGVELMQAVFRDMGLKQDEESLQMVKAAIASLADTHPVKSYIAIAPDLNFDAGVVDTFLHGRDKSFTVDDCLELVTSAGLVFQDWFLKSPYYPPMLTEPGNEFYAAVAQLSAKKIWSVMERVNTLNGCHFFLATHADRPTSSYRIDFSAPNALDYVPLFRLRAGISGQDVYRHDWTVRLDPTHLAFAQYINGELSIREIAQKVAQSGLVSADQSELELIALELFEGLWRFDFIAIDLGG
ncbi:class I SAM-dependent methyltransferase [Mycolicibacterium sp.]|uniref:class I SAM-dependent methyltransferase n=1 Tax=Mycolicibacterium sp. TaxID=2320850 RepID=UPI001A1D831B|nr:class I SAM-dependent methyltransferase [Mycolicibacterium sp.]MBJ7401072.1 class I SAM-dependent methyltransferase [Mycolicibacterium sp.]